MWVVESTELSEASADVLLPVAGLASLDESVGLDDTGELSDASVDELLARLADEVPMVTVEVQLLVMVFMTYEDAGAEPSGPVEAAAASELLFVGGRTPGMFDMVVVGVKPEVVTDVRVSGQIVVDSGTMEVRIEAEPLSGQLLTEDAQLRTVTSLVV